MSMLSIFIGKISEKQVKKIDLKKIDRAVISSYIIIFK